MRIIKALRIWRDSKMGYTWRSAWRASAAYN